MSTLVDSHVLLAASPDWSNPPEIERVWKTEVAAALLGNEERSTVLDAPRLKLTWTAKQFTGPIQNTFEEDLREALRTGEACAPLHGMASVISSVLLNVVTIEAAPDWAVGDYVFWADRSNPEDPVYEAIQITGIDGAEVTLDAVPTNTWSSGDLLWRLMFGFLSSPASQEAGDLDSGQARMTLIEREGSTHSGLGDIEFWDPQCYFIAGTDIEVYSVPATYAAMYACVGGWSWCESGGPMIPPCGAVTFTPASGEATTPCDVALSAPATIEGPCRIHFTTNGRTPTVRSPVYRSPIHLSDPGTIKAMAARDGFPDGPVGEASYALARFVPAPSIPSETTNFVGETSIEIVTPTTDPTVKYTTDGSTPGDGSPTYTVPVVVDADTTLKTRVKKDGEWSETTTITLREKVVGTFDLVATSGSDYCGQWDVFAPDSDDQEYQWQLALTFSKTTTIRSIEVFLGLASYAPFQSTYYFWSTDQPFSFPGFPSSQFHPFPLVVREGASQLNTDYGTPLGVFAAGAHTLDLYGQYQLGIPTGLPFTMLLTLDDGTKIAAVSPTTN